MAWPIAVPRDGRQVLRCASSSLSVSVVGGTSSRRCRRRRPGRSASRRLRLDERGRGLLGGGEPVRRDVGGAHRAGDVERQQIVVEFDGTGDGTPAAGRRRRRARRGRAASSAAGSAAATASARAAQRARAQPTSRARPRGGAAAGTTSATPSSERDGQQRQQRPRPGERHQTTRPVRRTVRMRPERRAAASANAVNAPASGNVLVVGREPQVDASMRCRRAAPRPRPGGTSRRWSGRSRSACPRRARCAPGSRRPRRSLPPRCRHRRSRCARRRSRRQWPRPRCVGVAPVSSPSENSTIVAEPQ